GRWSEVRPWKATYWHEEPIGYQVRYRIKRGKRIEDHVWRDFYPFVWQDFLPKPKNEPASLATRRCRTRPELTPPLQLLRDAQLERRLRDRSPLARLAAASELVSRTDSAKDLIGHLGAGCSVLRYCAAKALGDRKVAEAAPALLGVVFNKHDVAAVQALGRIADERTLEPLLVLFEWWRGYSSFSDPQFP